MLWSELPEDEAELFFEAYVASHQARVTALVERIEASGAVDLPLTLDPARLDQVWQWFLDEYYEPVPSVSSGLRVSDPAAEGYLPPFTGWVRPSGFNVEWPTVELGLSVQVVEAISLMGSFLAEIAIIENPERSWFLQREVGSESRNLPFLNILTKFDECPELRVAQRVVMCFGQKRPNLQVLAHTYEYFVVPPQPYVPLGENPNYIETAYIERDDDVDPIEFVGGGATHRVRLPKVAERLDARGDLLVEWLRAEPSMTSVWRESREVVLLRSAIREMDLLALAKRLWLETEAAVSGQVSELVAAENQSDEAVGPSEEGVEVDEVDDDLDDVEGAATHSVWLPESVEDLEQRGDVFVGLLRADEGVEGAWREDREVVFVRSALPTAQVAVLAQRLWEATR